MSTVTLLPNTDFTATLFERISKARKSVYISAFSFSLAERTLRLPVRNLVRLLAAKKKAGVDVKVIAGTRRKTDPTQPLQPLDVNNEVSLSILGAVGVPVAFHQDARYGSSHRKYVLVDERYSLVGSHNLSPRALSEGNDDSVEVDDETTGKALARVFRGDWSAATPLPAADRVTVNAALLLRQSETQGHGKLGRPIDGCAVELLFDRQYFREVLAALDTAATSIDIAMFYFGKSRSARAMTSQLAAALIKAHGRGVKVRLMLDVDQPGATYRSEQANTARLEQLRAAGIEVAFDDPATAMHSKLVVIDGETTFVGSHNWTEGSVSKYRELSVVVQSRKVAAAYGKALDRRHAAAQARERVSG
jgi:phosphatidylserine/phosphatidylglycerophosphate/cardiolipin synthase-like enzyme